MSIFTFNWEVLSSLLSNAHITDCLVALTFAFLTLSTLSPMMTYTGKILLQTTPTHVVPQLERCLQEALIIEGVLEVKNEHFWTVSFGKLVSLIDWLTSFTN